MLYDKSMDFDVFSAGFLPARHVSRYDVEPSGGDLFERKMRRAFENGTFADIVTEYEKMGFGGQTPVPHECISELPSGKVELDENCTEFMELMLEFTKNARKEIPFMLIGRTDGETNVIRFEKFYTVGAEDMSKLQQQECDPNLVFAANDEMVGDFKATIKSANEVGDRAIMCFGHTHPNCTAYYGTYDTADLRNVIQHDDSIDGVRRSVGDSRAQTVDCVITADGDMDFMFFDEGTEQFYKIGEVSGVGRDGTVQEMQNYSFRTPLPTNR